jgi:hypothetical protein
MIENFSEKTVKEKLLFGSRAKNTEINHRCYKFQTLVRCPVYNVGRGTCS